MAITQETLASPEIIAATLEKFIDIHCPISVSPVGIKDLFSSFIVKIDGHKLIIDQVIPKTGNTLFIAGETLDVRISHRGTAYQFQSTHIDYTIDNSGFYCHKISLPEKIHYTERRTDYRISLKLSDQRPVQVNASAQDNWKTILDNISQNGACLRIEGDHASFEPGDTLFCDLQLTSSMALKSEAQVKYCLYSPKKNETLIGVEFLQLSTPTKKQLQTFLMKLQRDHLRSSPLL